VARGAQDHGPDFRLGIDQPEPEKARRYKSVRGQGGFVRADWETATEIIAAANAYTIKQYGPDRVIGFSPIPAMSMVSYAAGARYLSLIGGACLSFYDWYCDLPPASPQIWGEQTDVPESADWYNSTYLIAWGSNVPQTRTPDAHFFTEVRYKGTKTVAVSSDFGEMVKFGDIWLAPKQGTDAALAMAMGHVVLKEFHATGKSAYFRDYVKQYTDMPLLVLLREQDGTLVPDHFLRASHLDGKLDQANHPEWKTLAIDDATGEIVAPNGSIGFRWGEAAHDNGAKVGRWNLEMKDGGSGREIDQRLSLIGHEDEVVEVGFPYFGGEHDALLKRRVPTRRLTLADGTTVHVATVYDLQMANYGVDQGLGGERRHIVRRRCALHPGLAGKAHVRAAQPRHPGRPRVRRQRRQDAGQEHGHRRRRAEPLVPQRHDLPRHHQPADDVRLHRQERWRLGALRRPGKAAPQTGWAPLAFALDWSRPPRQMNGTSFFYAHTASGVTRSWCRRNPRADRRPRATTSCR
jgi:nitrate reductase alpha subunit